MAQRIAGIAFLKVDGNQYPLRGSFTVTPSVIERAGIAGQDYIHGYSELPQSPVHRRRRVHCAGYGHRRLRHSGQRHGHCRTG